MTKTATAVGLPDLISRVDVLFPTAPAARLGDSSTFGEFAEWRFGGPNYNQARVHFDDGTVCVYAFTGSGVTMYEAKLTGVPVGRRRRHDRRRAAAPGRDRPMSSAQSTGVATSARERANLGRGQRRTSEPPRPEPSGAAHRRDCSAMIDARERAGVPLSTRAGRVRIVP